MDTSIHQRVRLLSDKQGGLVVFANLIEINHQTVSNVIKGKTKPSFKVVESILLRFPDINARWLITGEGEMKTKENEKSEKENNITQQTHHLLEKINLLEDSIKTKNLLIEKQERLLEILDKT